MIRLAEAVLPGHPDRFCDQVADAIVAEALRADPEAFAQIEVGVWSDQAWLSGSTVTRRSLSRSPADILVETGLSLGLDGLNRIDARDYRVTDTVCQLTGDPAAGRGVCCDQSIVVGYAGYDARTRFLPPEHFLAHALCDVLRIACRDGALKGCGPDGKIVVSLREEGSAWHLERVLVTLQHPQSMGQLELAAGVNEALESGYGGLRDADSRWRSPLDDVEVMVNPNGPLVRAGSDGDNGQTGRKLVMDYYGPRIPIGGGALAGKHPAHVDRLAAHAARNAAVHAVRTGAKECVIRVAFAPNRNEPLEVVWEMEGRGERQPRTFFNFDAMVARVDAKAVMGEPGRPTHFWGVA
jgi:S-adenosylmethionine synthetase